jgi:hypothetical protein
MVFLHGTDVIDRISVSFTVKILRLYVNSSLFALPEQMLFAVSNAGSPRLQLVVRDLLTCNKNYERYCFS